MSFEASRRCPSTTEALTPPPIVLIFAAMVAIESPAATARHARGAGGEMQRSAAVAEASVLDCVRTSARARALTVTENEAFTALAEAVATIRAGSLEVATGRDENTPAPQRLLGAAEGRQPRAHVGQAGEPGAGQVGRALEAVDGAPLDRHQGGDDRVGVDPDEIPVKLSPAISVHARRSMPRSQSERSSAKPGA